MHMVSQGLPYPPPLSWSLIVSPPSVAGTAQTQACSLRVVRPVLGHKIIDMLGSNMIYAREKAEKAQKSRKQIRWLIGKMANINSTVAFTTEKVDISSDATFVIW